MSPKRFRRLLWFSMAVPAALVLVMAVVVLIEVGELRRSLEWVDRTDAAIAEGRALMRRIVDAETGLRGYLITGHEEFLEPWSRHTEIPGRFANLISMVRDDSQQEKLRTASADFQEWGKYSQRMIDLRRSHGDYQNFDINLEGKQRMDAIRGLFDAFMKRANELRTERIAHSGDLDRAFKFSLVLLSMVLVTTLVLFSRHQLNDLAGQYDEALQASEEKAAQERERKQWFLALLRSVADAVIATDAQGAITFMNPAAEAATGWSEADARGVDLQRVFRIVNADTHESVENPVEKVRRLNTVVGLANHTLLIRRNGEELNIDDSGAPIRDENDELIGIILVFRDITRQYEMERTLRTTERLALAGRITASVAHEIHNPLDTVGNLLHLIQNDADESHRREYAGLAAQELRRVSHVTRSMLSLYRESQLPVSVSLNEILSSVLTLLEMQIRNKQAQVKYTLPAEVMLEGFPAELRQVFTNLLHNALDAIPQGGCVTVECEDPDGRKDISVSIADNGHGITTENLARIFQPLFTTKGINGTGLGLWVSKGIVEKHGGSITVSSGGMGGTMRTVFTVKLPRRFPGATSRAAQV